MTWKRTRNSAAGSTRGYQVSSILHMLDLELGWQWPIWQQLSLRAAIGFAGTVGAQTTVKPNFQPLVPSAQNAFTAYAANYLNSIYTSYVFVPVVTVATGWSFF